MDNRLDSYLYSNAIETCHKNYGDDDDYYYVICSSVPPQCIKYAIFILFANISGFSFDFYASQTIRHIGSIISLSAVEYTYKCTNKMQK